MAYSIKEKIMQDMVEAVLKVREVSGYTATIEESAIERNKTTPIKQDVFPAAFIYEGAENVVEREHAGVYTKTIIELMVSVELWCCSVDNLPTAINELEADVITAVMKDSTRGGYAHCTEFNSSEPFLVEGRDMGGRIVNFLITYERRENDPREEA